MRRALALLAAVFLSTPAAADPPLCPQGAVGVSTRLTAETPVIDASQTADALGNMAGGGQILGMTVPAWTGDIDIRFKRSNLWDVACTEAQQAEYALTYKTTVYIAAELKDLPCAYQAVTAAEQDLVNNGYLAAHDALPQLRQVVSRYFIALGPKLPTTVTGMDGRQKDVTDGAKQAAATILGDIKKNYEQRPAAALTTEAIAAACPDEAALLPGAGPKSRAPRH